ncbi:DNA polymerase III subunit delta [uncultured Succinatimonas sp.]|uniref:DNA polymerase III subunit delta n=1 Tax=uncultured Succinatimonas sp. TaxID=1262973 RepID=UPI0025E4A172|nr:hypothetical protein [uncultured Succinatimonas sp.]
MQIFVPVFILSSDDPLLKNDRSSEIYHSYKERYPESEYLLFTYSDFASSGQSNLAVLENELIDGGLFTTSKIIKIYLKDIDKTAADVLMLLAKYISKNREDLQVIIDLPRIAASFNKASAKPFAEESKKGRKADLRVKDAIAYLKNQNSVLEIMYPPSLHEMPGWISSRSRRYGLYIDPDAAVFLASAYEGNLTAIDQCLQIVKMTAKTEKITIKDIFTYFSKDSRFSGFELTDAILDGQGLRALNILNSLCSLEGNTLSTNLPLILSRLDNALSALAAAKTQNLRNAGFQEKTAFFAKYGIRLPQSQNSIMKAALQMPDILINYLNKTLASASKAYSSFDNKTAFLCLQRICTAVNNFSVMNLEEL